MYKTRVTANISNGMVANVPIPASFIGIDADANAVVLIRDGGSGPFVLKQTDVNMLNGARSLIELHWPVWCANGIHCNISGGNAVVRYV